MPATTRFPLGVFVGNPNRSDPAAEKSFETAFNNFVLVVGGAKPTTMNAFTDFGQDPSLWAGNAAYAADSWAKSPVVGTSITPIIGIPMSDSNHWAGNAAGSTNDDFFKGIINGTYDADYRGIVDGWANGGFKTIELRLGYEMDGNYMPWSMGNDAATQGDWVKAFQHLSTLMHVEAKADGVTAKVVWNPASSTQSTLSVQAAYPGDAYVDVISIDQYSPLYPKGYYDWAKNDGSVYPNKQTWWADPINREHFWSHPNGDQYFPNGRDNGFGIEDAIAMAKAHGKPVALSETGAGGDGTTTGPSDEADFPKWLASELASAQSQGVAIDHVNIWDARLSDGNWDFSSPGAAKPLEAAAWAKYFGAGSSPNVQPATDTLKLSLSEDAWQGDAQAIITVDGKTAGATVTVTALHNQGKTQSMTLSGQWGPGVHDVGVQFINDAYGGSSATDRNLYIDTVSLDGQTSATPPAALFSNGTAHFATAASPLVLQLSEDAYLGDAQFSVAVDGKALGPAQSVTVLHASGGAQNFGFGQAIAAGAHDVAVSFLNDAWAGTAATDRNLYVNAIDVNGSAVAGTSASLLSTSTQHFSVVVAAHA